MRSLSWLERPKHQKIHAVDLKIFETVQISDKSNRTHISVDKYKWSILEKPKSMFIASETDDDADLYRRDLIMMIFLVLLMILIEIEGSCRVCRHV